MNTEKQQMKAFNDWAIEFNVGKHYCEHKPFEDNSLLPTYELESETKSYNWQLITVIAIGILFIVKTVL